MGYLRQSSLKDVEDRKNELVEKLSTQYSLNQISMEEYERLIKYSQDIETEKELKIFEKIIKEHDAPDIKNDDDDDEMPARTHQSNFTIMSSRKTTGPIRSGNFVTIMGDHKIVINEEDLIKNKTVLNVFVLMGDMIIYVPENVSVFIKAFPLMADIIVPDALSSKADQKKLIINGAAIMSDIKVKIRK